MAVTVPAGPKVVVRGTPAAVMDILTFVPSCWSEQDMETVEEVFGSISRFVLGL